MNSDEWEKHKNVILKVLQTFAEKLFGISGYVQNMIRLIKLSLYSRGKRKGRPTDISGILEVCFLMLSTFLSILFHYRSEIRENMPPDMWFIVNIYILVSYVMIKIVLVVIPILIKKCMDKKKGFSRFYKIINMLYLKFYNKPTPRYVQEPITKLWFLKEEYIYKRKYWRSCLIFWLSFFLILHISSLKNYIGYIQYFFPMIFVIWSLEKYAQYDWITEKEYCKCKYNLSGLNGESSSLVIIHQELKELLGEKALMGHEASRNDSRKITSEEIENILHGEEHEQQLLSKFLEKRPEIKEAGGELLEAALELLKGHSVLFKTSFYKDLDYAFFLPVYLKLVREQNILIVCSAKVKPMEVTDWIKSGIEKLNGMNWWRFNIYEPFYPPGQVMAIYSGDFRKFWHDDNCIEFRKQIGMLLLLEPLNYDSFCRDKLQELYNSQKECTNINLAICSSREETLDYFNWGFQENGVYKGQLWRTARKAHVMYWKEEEVREEWGIEPKILKYLTDTVTSENIFWIGGRILPVKDLLWSYARYCGMESGNRIAAEEYGYNLTQCSKTFIVAQDYQYNCLKMADFLMSRGSETAMLHIVVPYYMLRDYIWEHKEDMFLKEGLTISNCRSIRNTLHNIFHRLLNEWIPLKQIDAELELLDSEAKTEEGFQELMASYLNIDGLSQELKSRYVNGEGVCCHVNTESKIKKYLQKEEKISFWDVDNRVLKNVPAEVNYNSIYQRYLPGQFLVLNNKKYEFVQVLEREGKYYAGVKRVSSMVKGKKYYRQIREFALNNIRSVQDSCSTVYPRKYSSVFWGFKEADIKVSTGGYLEMEQFHDLENAVIGISRKVPERIYKKKRYIEIKIINAVAETVLTMASWLKEAFYSLCPDFVDYISVCMEDDVCIDYKKACISKIEIIKNESSQNTEDDEGICIYIIEDMDKDTGILQNMYEKQVQIMDTMYNYMLWSGEKEIYPFLKGADASAE